MDRALSIPAAVADEMRRELPAVAEQTVAAISAALSRLAAT